MDENGVGDSPALYPVSAPAGQSVNPYPPATSPVSPISVNSVQSVDGMVPPYQQPQPTPLAEPTLAGFSTQSLGDVAPPVYQQTPPQPQTIMPTLEQLQPTFQPAPLVKPTQQFSIPQQYNQDALLDQNQLANPNQSVGPFSTIQDPEMQNTPDQATYDPYAVLAADPMPDITIGDSSARGGSLVFKLVVGILLIAIFVGGIYGGYLYGKNSNQVSSVPAPTSQEPIQYAEPEEELPPQSEDDAKISFTLQDPVYKDEVITGSVGKQINLSDGLIVYVKDDVEYDYKTTDTNYKQASDKKLIKVNYIVGNASKTGAKQIKSTLFSLEDTVGTIMLPESTISDYAGKIDVVSLNPGAKARFSVVYEVGSYVGGLTAIRQQSYILKSTKKTVTTRAEVALSPSN